MNLDFLGGLLDAARHSGPEPTESAWPRFDLVVSDAEAVGGGAGVPDVPWRLTYRDGSGNAYHFTASTGGVDVEYAPVTPEMSSTGTYSGGEHRRTQLVATDPQLAAVWQRARALEADRAAHTTERAKRTGAFELDTPAGARQFIVTHGPALDDFDELVTRFRVDT